MTSLSNYLDRDTEAETACGRVIGLFLQGISLHSVEGDKADFEQFKREIDKCLSTLSSETQVSELLAVMGRALGAMEEYNHRTSTLMRRQNIELQQMVVTLTQNIVSIEAGYEHSVTRLRSIETSIENTQAIEDIQILRLRLSECLEAVRQDAARQQSDGKDMIESLKKQLKGSQELMGSIALRPDIDAATGLPGKAAADRAIRAAMESPQGRFLLVAVCNRVQAVNARFGYSVGDKVLAAFAEHFKKGLPASDPLFRWQGPSLVAILERDELLDRVRAEVQQFADVRLDKTIEVAQRTVLIPISAVWTIFPLAPPLDVFLQQVDTFTAAQVPHD